MLSPCPPPPGIQTKDKTADLAKFVICDGLRTLLRGTCALGAKREIAMGGVHAGHARPH